MARRKAAKNCDLRPWLSARCECDDGRFIQVGNSLLLSSAFQRLSAGAQVLYFCMAMECGGRRGLIFPKAAAKKYGIAERSLRRHIDELTDAGFIETTSLKNLRKPNEYLFSLRWKEEKPP